MPSAHCPTGLNAYARPALPGYRSVMTDNEKWKGTGYADVSKALLFVTAAFFVTALGTLAVPGWQIYQWLRLGYWQPLTNADGLAYIGAQAPWTSWAGVERMIEWWLAQSLGGWLFAGFLSMAAVTFWLALLADAAELELKHKWIDARRTRPTK